MPLERHKAILDGVYSERDTAQKALKDWEQYAWAKTVKREDLDAFAALNREPVQFAIDLIERFKAHPTYGPQLRSHAARTLANRAARVDVNPDLVVRDDAGREIATYSADRVKQIVAQAVQDAIGKEVQPLKQDHAQRQAQAKAAETRERIDKAVDDLWGRAQTWHGFKDHVDAINTTMAAHPTWSLQDAYLDVLHGQILPNLSKTERTKVLADLNAQPAASVASPSSGTAAVSKPDASKSWEELFKEEYGKATARR